MKKYKIAILSSLVLFFSAIGFTGDLGGGGTTKIPAGGFELSDLQKAELLKQGTPQSAFVHWVNQMDEKTRSEVFKKVFQVHILPQLTNQ